MWYHLCVRASARTRAESASGGWPTQGLHSRSAAAVCVSHANIYYQRQTLTHSLIVCSRLIYRNANWRQNVRASELVCVWNVGELGPTARMFVSGLWCVWCRHDIDVMRAMQPKSLYSPHGAGINERKMHTPHAFLFIHSIASQLVYTRVKRVHALSLRSKHTLFYISQRHACRRRLKDALSADAHFKVSCYRTPFNLIVRKVVWFRVSQYLGWKVES